MNSKSSCGGQSILKLFVSRERDTVLGEERRPLATGSTLNDGLMVQPKLRSTGTEANEVREF